MIHPNLISVNDSNDTTAVSSWEKIYLNFLRILLRFLATFGDLGWGKADGRRQRAEGRGRKNFHN
jgi:hypothetical protein